MTYTEYSEIEVEVDDRVATLRFNRPDRLNAMSTPLQLEVIDALDRFEQDDEVRAVVLCGAGRVFSAGYDLSDPDEEAGLNVVQWRELLAGTERYIRRIWTFKKPIIAAVHGHCLAGAAVAAMACDMTIASSDCKLGQPESRFASASTMIMPYIVPAKIAKEMLLMGGSITAQRAYEIGMVNKVVPADQLMEQALTTARLIAQAAPLAIQVTKEAINRSYELMGLMESWDYNALLMAVLDVSSTEEGDTFNAIRGQEGLKAAITWRDARYRPLEDRLI